MPVRTREPNRHRILHMEERDIDELFEEVMAFDGLKLKRKIIPCTEPELYVFVLQLGDAPVYKFEDPEQGGTWLYWWDAEGKARRTEIGKRRLRRILERYQHD